MINFAIPSAALRMHDHKAPQTRLIGFTVLLILTTAISGCASLGKGVAEAVMERQTEDTRVCQVIGKSFPGVAPSLEHKQGTSKILMVHGVGSHIPGYSSEFLEKLAKELGLSVQNSRYREISLVHPEDTKKKLGTLRVKRLLDPAMEKELLFYELTWSAVTDKEKAVLAYDNSGEYSYRRAKVNDLLKKFSNDTGPDPMIYLGQSHDDILMSFRQSLCWMIGHSWDGLPESAAEACTSLSPDTPINDEVVQNLARDDYAIVSHSLGSRITMDSLQQIAQTVAVEDKKANKTRNESRFIDEFRNKEITLYMLSNQLPLLQMGRKLPTVHGAKNLYCEAGASHYGDRILNRTSIIAFSDPNDILSYAIPYGFTEKYLDSRLCIDVTNVNINIAEVVDLFGFGKVANPLTAHTDYDRDDRVVGLIAHGIGNNRTTQEVTERCEWIRLVD